MIDVSSKETRAAFYNSTTWKDKRQEILERDNFECLMCVAEGKVTTQAHSVLEIDHIEELKDRPDLAMDNDNLRTLCKDHHNKRHKRFNYRPRKKENRLHQKFPERWD